MSDWRILERVRISADHKAEAEERLEGAIIEAHLAGFSLREIEQFAGVSRESIRRLLARKGL